MRRCRAVVTSAVLDGLVEDVQRRSGLGLIPRHECLAVFDSVCLPGRAGGVFLAGR